jgi:hypothetical protein
MRVTLLCLLLSAGIALASSSSPSFSFHDFLLGDWQVAFIRSNPAVRDDPIVERWTWKLSDSPTGLPVGEPGYLQLEGTASSGDEVRRLQFQFEDPRTGSFLWSQRGDDLNPVLNFQLSNYTDGCFLSRGLWLASGRAQPVYQLSICSATSFVLTVFADGKLDELVGHKQGVVLPQTFLQKYGSYVLLFGMLVLSQYLKYRASNARQPAAATPAPPAAGAAASAATEKAKAQ